MSQLSDVTNTCMQHANDKKRLKKENENMGLIVKGFTETAEDALTTLSEKEKEAVELRATIAKRDEEVRGLRDAAAAKEKEVIELQTTVDYYKHPNRPTTLTVSPVKKPAPHSQISPSRIQIPDIDLTDNPWLNIHNNSNNNNNINNINNNRQQQPSSPNNPIPP
eukprot:185970_1